MKNPIKPAYIRSYNEKILQTKILKINEIILKCRICPHYCETNRTRSYSGSCNSGELPIIASFSPHFGEESPLTGYHGSGTIFFGNCNLGCTFCQNFDISQCGAGEEVSIERLAKIMIFLQNQGCHNINFVTPTHMIHAILNALPPAIEMGLNIPLVYNSGGYDEVSTIQLLEGIFDIYMPDMKYMDNRIAKELSGVDDYVEHATASILEMHRQVGDLKIDENGLARRGLIIRHLVLPGQIAATNKVIDFVASVSKDTYFNLMDQYRPAYQAGLDPRINRPLTSREFQEAYDYAVGQGLTWLAD